MTKEKSSKKPLDNSQQNNTIDKNKISYNDFAKLDLRVGKIIKVEEHPNADKLYILEVDLGNKDKRTIVAGLRLKYKKEELIGKKAVFVANLEPAIIRGVESNGMLLAAGDDHENIIILAPEKDIKEGSKIR